MEYNSKTRKTKTSKYKSKLNKLFCNVDEGKKEAAEILTSRAAFLLCSLDELEEIIYNNGFISTYTNGSNQSGQMVSPAVKTYKMNMNQLLDVFKHLKEYLPEQSEKDDLQDFLKGHKKI